jgi:hypothetical protein
MSKKTKHAKAVIYVPYFAGYRPRLNSVNFTHNESNVETTYEIQKKMKTILRIIGNNGFLDITELSFIIYFSGNFHECDKSDINQFSDKIRKNLEKIIFEGVIYPIYEKNPSIELYVKGNIICSAFIQEKESKKVSDFKLNLSESKPYSIVKPILENYINSICKEYEVALDHLLSRVSVKNFVGIAWPSERLRNDYPKKMKNISKIRSEIKTKIDKAATVTFLKSLDEIFRMREPLERDIALKSLLEHVTTDLQSLINSYEKEAIEALEILNKESQDILEKYGELEVNNMPGSRCTIL